MDGIFIRKKTIVLLIFILIFGLFAVSLYLFPYVTGMENTRRSPTLLFFGVFCVLVPITIMLMNHGAYLRIDENSIHAKYHYFGKLDCRVDEVAFAFPQLNMLTILLKNGKRHIISGLENSWDLSAEIRRQNFCLEAESPDVLRQELRRTQAVRRKEIWYLCGGFVVLFINLSITVRFTGGKDFSEFTKLDWIIFGITGVIGLFILVWMFYSADRCGKRILPIEHLKFRLRSAVITTQQLPPNSRSIYTDESFTCRIAVCNLPKDEGVYFCIQEFVQPFELETIYTSEFLDSGNELSEDLSLYFDITTSFLSS